MQNDKICTVFIEKTDGGTSKGDLQEEMFKV